MAAAPVSNTPVSSERTPESTAGRHGRQGADGGPDEGAPRSTLVGALERVTYHNEENGWTVARLTPRGKGYTVTVVGPMSGVNVGSSLKLWGHWTTHAKFGKQFAVDDYVEQLPATIEGIRRYLGSGLIRGVGPVTADRIVDHFGLETLTVIDEHPDRLHEVPGVGQIRARQITSAWQEQQEIKEIMLFLQTHGVSTGLAVRIYKHYGTKAIGIVRDDPYKLAREVFGIGFRTADQIARKMGIAPDSPRRLEAGVLFTLSALADEGHVYGRRDQLIESAAAQLSLRPEDLREGESAVLPPQAISDAVDELIGTHELRVEPVEPSNWSVPVNDAGSSDGDAVYLPPFYYAEIGVANRIRRLVKAEADRLSKFQTLDWATALDWVDRRSPYPLAARQREAVRMALTNKVVVLTGGPGTGKTTTVRAVLQLLDAKGCSVKLCAPTGRAAKRLSDTAGREAKTIHRLLEFKPASGKRFLRGEDYPLDTDMVVVDEVSMLDLILMNDLTKAVHPNSHLLLVGDVDQLPSVGAGNVLSDLIASGAVPTVYLDQIFRQDKASYIIVNAHRINQGEMPLFEKDSADFFLFPAEDAAEAADWVVDVVANRLPLRFGIDPLRDVQVLSPMHRGAAGVAKLNERLQEALNPPADGKTELRLGERTFRRDDKVMQIRNNYDKDVFNGDLGHIVSINRIDRVVAVDFEGTRVDYDVAEMDELVHAFACSTHKSQGAEYPVVVMTLLPAHYLLLQRNLLYTGVTRAKRLCVIVGSKRAIGMAVRNDEVAARNSGLARRLRGAVG